MPVIFFLDEEFVWPPPPSLEPEVRAPAPPKEPAPLAAARRLLVAFRRVQQANPREWRARIAVEEGFSGETMSGRSGRWAELGGRCAQEHPAMVMGAPFAEDIVGLEALSRALFRCRRTLRGLDLSDTRGAALHLIVNRILRARWAVGPLVPLEPPPSGEGAVAWHSIAVAYPTDLLELLAEWIAAAKRKRGRKPDPESELIAKRCERLKAEGHRWKDMPPLIEAEFNETFKSESLRKNWMRWRRGTKTGTE